MRTNRYIFFSAISAILFSACATEPVFDPQPESELIPLNISGAIEQVETRATAEGFVDKDAVGLFAVNYSENNTVAGTLALEGNQADNVKYVFDEPNQKWVPVKPVYYKNINTNVDLYLYYPHRAEINDINSATFEVRKDQSSAATATSLSGYEASDWMWGKQIGVTPSESKVRIPLSHRLAAVQVTLGEGTGFEEGEFESLEKNVILTGTTRKATLDFATGTATPVGAAQLDGIVMCPQTDGAFRAVVIPQTVAAGTKLLAITVNGIAYPFTQGEDVVYQQGKQTNVTISINKKSATGEYEIEFTSAQIVDWTEDLNSHGGEARQYYVVNVDTPGTLGRIIKAAGKNPDRIRNLKVTGNVTSSDFFFMRDSMAILEAVNMKESRVKDALVAKTNNNGNVVGVVVQDDAIPLRAFNNKRSLTHFVFPQHITRIENGSFSNTMLSGSLVLPDALVSIGNNDYFSYDENGSIINFNNVNAGAFANTQISSVVFPEGLMSLGHCSFYLCKSLSGELEFPNSLEIIGQSAFSGCTSLKGHLHLPGSLCSIGGMAFYSSGSFDGDLYIPEGVTKLGDYTFFKTTFTGSLYLNNVKELASETFEKCGFTGELIIPEGIQIIPDHCFSGNAFSSIVFPSSLKSIGVSAFFDSNGLNSALMFPEGLLSIGDAAFQRCSSISELSFPSSLQSIGRNAFNECFGISGISSEAVEIPSVGVGAFTGVAKDNFTVEVPPQSVKRYQAESGWSDFKRIAAHYDFSLNRERIRVLNGSITRTYILRAPANFSWSIQEKPDWVTVEPSSGTGKTDITVTVAEMSSADVSSFEINEGTFNSPSYKTYSGRAGEIVFLLNDKDYTCSMAVEQYDYDYPDGYVQTLQTATKGAGIDIVFTGDGYDAKDIAKGTFTTNAEEGYEHFFAVEPYKSYKEYFNVYAVTAMSDESGIGTVNTIKDSKFGSTFTQNRILLEEQDEVFSWAKKADALMELSKSLVILLQNTSTYEGITYMYGDGSAIACCPVSTQAYPYDFRGIIQHEAGGHGLGKLADEYIYHNAFIQNCECIDGCEHPKNDTDIRTSYGNYKSFGWFKNLSMTSDPTQVPWAHLLYNPKYSDYVDMYEGGYMHSRGIYRSEATSCMNNNIPYFSAISRQAIVERIMEYAGEEFTLEKFYAKDDDSFGPTSRAAMIVDRTFGVDPKYFRATGQGPVFMGDHPNVK